MRPYQLRERVVAAWLFGAAYALAALSLWYALSGATFLDEFLVTKGMK